MGFQSHGQYGVARFRTRVPLLFCRPSIRTCYFCADGYGSCIPGGPLLLAFALMQSYVPEPLIRAPAPSIGDHRTLTPRWVWAVRSMSWWVSSRATSRSRPTCSQISGRQEEGGPARSSSLAQRDTVVELPPLAAGKLKYPFLPKFFQHLSSFLVPKARKLWVLPSPLSLHVHVKRAILRCLATCFLWLCFAGLRGPASGGRGLREVERC